VSVHSTVPAVKAALFNFFQASPALSGVQVTYSHPGNTLQNSVIYLGDVQGTSHYPTMRAGRKAREEDYILDCWILVADSNSDSISVETTAFTMMGAVEDVIANDPTLGSLDGVKWSELTGFELIIGMDDSRFGWAAQLKLEISVTARLS
jgi:hypothetical protein